MLQDRVSADVEAAVEPQAGRVDAPFDAADGILVEHDTVDAHDRLRPGGMSRETSDQRQSRRRIARRGATPPSLIPRAGASGPQSPCALCLTSGVATPAAQTHTRPHLHISVVILGMTN